VTVESGLAVQPIETEDAKVSVQTKSTTQPRAIALVVLKKCLAIISPGKTKLVTGRMNLHRPNDKRGVVHMSDLKQGRKGSRICEAGCVTAVTSKARRKEGPDGRGAEGV